MLRSPVLSWVKFKYPPFSFSLLPPSSSASTGIMTDKLYVDATPDDVKNAKGLHLITQNTPNGQATQIMLEELGAAYGTKWTTSVINISTNVQKDEWFLRLNPNGRIPTLVDNTQSPPVPVIETSAQMLYLLKFFDKEDQFGFKDEFERLNALEWMFFWHGTSHLSLTSFSPLSHLIGHSLAFLLTRLQAEVLLTKAKSTTSRELHPRRSLMQLSASRTRLRGCMVSLRSVCLENTLASLETTWLERGKENIAWQTSSPGAGSRVGNGQASQKRRWSPSHIC